MGSLTNYNDIDKIILLTKQILEKSNDITSMTMEEYKLYIEEYTKKSKYPDISK